MTQRITELEGRFPQAVVKVVITDRVCVKKKLGGGEMNIEVKGKNLEVYSTDLYGLYSWNEAVKAVKLLGDGWRLPTKDELNQMYLKKKEICGFVAIYYWSSSEDGLYYAWNQNFVNGYQLSELKYDLRRIRPVRDLKPLKSALIK